MGVLPAADLGSSLLGGDGGLIEDRMVIDEAAQHLALVHPALGIEADAEGLRRANPLQDVHVVSHQGARLVVTPEPIVPAGPGLWPGRQAARIGVQPDVVGLIGHGAENGLLPLACIRQQGQRLIAVAGEDHLVKVLLPVAA